MGKKRIKLRFDLEFSIMFVTFAIAQPQSLPWLKFTETTWAAIPIVAIQQQ